MEEKAAVINYAMASKCFTALILMWTIGVILLVCINAILIACGVNDDDALTIVNIPWYVGCAILSFYWSVSLGKNKWLWTLLGLTPIISQISTLLLANATHKKFKENGIKMNFFGGIKK